MKFELTKTEGKWYGDDMTNYMATLKDGTYYIDINKKTKKRTTPENSYYWGVVIEMIADYTGHDPDEIHEAMKLKYLRKGVDKYGLITTRSTASLTTTEFEEYLEKVRAWAAVTLSLTIPLPNE